MKLNPDAGYVALCAELGGIPDLNCISHQPNCTQVLCNFIFIDLQSWNWVSFCAMSEHRQLWLNKACSIHFILRLF